MSINIFARATKLTDVCGRIDYISNPDRQEHLMATARTVDQEYWRKLAADSQSAFMAAGGKRMVESKNGELVEARCCEAREFIGALPNSALSRNQEELAEEIASWWKKSTGADCIVALHQNKTMSQLHFHLIYSERELLQEPEIRIADRNAFIDEEGRRRRTKKEILDADGELRPGCKIVPKGAVLSERYFGDKNPMFSDKGWLYSQKQQLVDWINQELDPDLKRTVFDKYGPYLAQEHIGHIREDGPTEHQKRLEAWNKNVKEFNKLVKSGVISEDQALHLKTRIALAPDQLLELMAIRAEIYSVANPDLPKVYQDIQDLAGKVQRTKEGPDEERKRKLREAYRRSQLAWQKYRATKEGSLERRTALAEARKISAEILRRERELGYDRPHTTSERRQAVWEAYGEQKAAAQTDEAKDQRRGLQKEQAVAWQEYQYALKEYQYRYKGRRNWTPAREAAKERLDEARAAYQCAREKSKFQGDVYKLLQDYRSYALALASDPEVPQSEADRALDRYKAACRRLQEPDATTAKELRRQLSDLQRSHQSRQQRKAQQISHSKEPDR